jgi:alpha-galactosidase
MVAFGKREVQDYFCTILDRYIDELGIRYLRWDQNNNLLPYWSALDGDRKGISQIRHVEGLHRAEDYVWQHHPEVIFEICAGGGQRVDLQTLQRRHTSWLSDETMDPLIARFHLEGAIFFLPGNSQLVGFSPPYHDVPQAWLRVFGHCLSKLLP